MNVVETLFEKKLMEKNSFIENTYVVGIHFGIASMRQFKYVPTTYVTENKETSLKLHLNPVPCPLSLPILNISNYQALLEHLSLSKIVYRHDSYISKFDLMNCFFANLVIAWLYNLCKHFGPGSSFRYIPVSIHPFTAALLTFNL